MTRLELCVLVLSAWAGACNSDSGEAVLAPLSRDCEACLTGTIDTAQNCGVEYGACSGDPSCNDAMVCELRNGCYESAPGGSCASSGGCVIAGDAGTAVAARAAFEACARTECAEPCGFVAP